MKMKFIVIENSCDGRNIVLITESQKKAHKVADTLQEINDSTCENILYEVEHYVRFKGLKHWDYNGKLKKDKSE
jgi:hypothetical protein